MKKYFLVVLAMAMLAVSACGRNKELETSNEMMEARSIAIKAAEKRKENTILKKMRETTITKEEASLLVDPLLTNRPRAERRKARLVLERFEYQLEAFLQEKMPAEVKEILSTGSIVPYKKFKMEEAENFFWNECVKTHPELGQFYGKEARWEEHSYFPSFWTDPPPPPDGD